MIRIKYFKDHCTAKLKCHGFTLIEVMVALAILSLVVISLSLAVSQSTKNITSMKERQFAAWVAQNQLNLYLLAANNASEGTKNVADIQYIWRVNVEPTNTEKFNKVTVSVATTKRPNYVLADIIAFLGVE